MIEVIDLLSRVAGDVWRTFAHNWPFLLVSVVAAAALPVYVGTDRLRTWLRKRVGLAIVAAVVLATITPFCSCGTTAIVLGALATRVPWAPVVAFMVASPLTSPEEYALSTGLFGFAFATTFFIAAIVLGLASGFVTHLIERTGWLEGQARLADKEECGTGSCDASASPAARELQPGSPGGGTVVATLPIVSAPPVGTFAERYKLAEFGRELAKNTRRLALYFFGFAALGYLLIELVPTRVLTDYLGGSSPLAAPLAALLGIPVYLNSDGSLPLVATLMEGGMGSGPALAFLVTGAGTSIGAISGMFVIARIRVVALVVGFLFGGALILGWLAPLWL